MATFAKKSRTRVAIVQSFSDNPAQAVVGLEQELISAHLTAIRNPQGDSYIGLTIDIPLGKGDQSANENAGFGVRHTYDRESNQVIEQNTHEITIKFPREGFTLEAASADSSQWNTDGDLAYVTIHLTPGATSTIKGFGTPFANVQDKAIEAVVNDNYPLGTTDLTLEEIVTQREFRLVVKGTPASIASEFSVHTLPAPFAYPYGTDHTWAKDKYVDLLKTTASKSSFAPAYSYEDDNAHVAVTSHINCQDTLWLDDEVAQIAKYKNHAYFVPMEDKVSRNNRGRQYFLVLPYAHEIHTGKHRNAWCRLTKEGGFKLVIDGSSTKWKCCVVGNPKEIEALQDHARLQTDLVLHILSDAPAKKDDTFEPSFFVNRQQAEMAGRAQ